MKTYGVGELKGKFSTILDLVRGGEEIALSYGRKKEKIAIILPYARFRRPRERKLGLLRGTARCIIHENFRMTDDELTAP